MSRAYGWTSDGLSLIDDEAAELRAAAQAVIDGTPMRAIVADLNGRGVETVTGKPWAPLTVRRALTNPRIAGHHKHVPAILDHTTWTAVCDVLNDPSRQQFAPHGATRTHSLLSGGLARCGLCDRPLSAATNGAHRPVAYVCPARINTCPGVSVKAGLIEPEVVERVLARLCDPTWRAALATELTRSPEDYDRMIVLAEQRMIVLAEQFGAGAETTNVAALDAGVQACRTAIRDAQNAKALVTATGSLPAPSEEAVVAWWIEMSIDAQRDIVGAILDHVVVSPRIPGARIVEDRLRFVWRSTDSAGYYPKVQLAEHRA